MSEWIYGEKNVDTGLFHVHRKPHLPLLLEKDGDRAYWQQKWQEAQEMIRVLRQTILDLGQKEKKAKKRK